VKCIDIVKAFIQLDICTYAYRSVGHKQLCCFRCILVVCMSKMLMWMNIIQDYMTQILLGKLLQVLLSKICYHSISNSIIKCGSNT